MDLERALETQRLRLLRVVAGWIAVLRFLSGAPFSVPCSLRQFFASLVIRAELAAQYLVTVSVRLQGGNSQARTGPKPDRALGGDDVPSVEDLMRRMAALCDLLENLPRAARRLIRASDKGKRSQARPRPILTVVASPMTACAQITPESLAPRTVWPPDIQCAQFVSIPSPRVPAGGKGGCGLSVEFSVPI